MSTVICQGFKPCLDSQFIEKTMLKLKIVEPKSPTPNFPSLQNTHHGPKKIFLDEKMDFSKPFSSLRLSDKSLELCTERLGSESGSDTSEVFDFETEKMLLENEQRNFNFRPLKEIKKANPPQFPPPLTTISGSNSLQVRPHREDGRLVMKAIHAPTFGSYFQAERNQGQLRLTIFKNHLKPENDSMADEKENKKNVFNAEIQENQEYQDEEEISFSEEGEQEEDLENDNYEEGEQEEDQENDDYEECDQEEEVYEEEYDENEDYYAREDWNAITKDVGMKMGIKKFQRASRCIEEGGHGDKGWCRWDAIWVATS